ncbi:MAG: phosphoglycolate phosphatase [Acidiferrobacteraceae bacterium]
MSVTAMAARASALAARLVFMDLDGTLVDTAPDLTDAVNRMLADLGRAPYDDGVVARWIGNGVKRLVKRALTGTMDGEPEGELFDRGYRLFLGHYRNHLADRGAAFPGAEAVLSQLRSSGFRLVCITNKAEAFTLPLLDLLDLRRYFDLVLSGDTLPKCKPDPLPLLHACREFGVDPAEAVLVGDSGNDVQAARAAGTAIICVRYGYNQGVDLAGLRPDFLIDRLSELPPLLSHPPNVH